MGCSILKNQFSLRVSHDNLKINYNHMKTEDDLLFYDDVEAVKFILQNLPTDLKDTITEEKIEYVLDVIYEFYDEQGLIEEDTAEAAYIDEEDMFLYLKKCIKKDAMNISEEEIIHILEGEYEYGKSIGVYE
jgi:hypothetical protein